MQAVFAHGGAVAVHDLAAIGAMLLLLAGLVAGPVLRGLSLGRALAAPAPRRSQPAASGRGSGRGH